MRPLARFTILLAGWLLFAGPTLSQAAEMRYFDDAALRAVQFYDLDEGWAVGDEGVVWHSIDGGRNWERQSTGVRGSLRSVHFIDPYTGWIAGREELPQGGSAGLLLYTRDGGLNWKRLLGNSLPGLNLVRFVDEKVGFLAGDGSDQLPSGLYQTNDGGKNWQPVPGKRAPSWLAAHFGPGGAGVLAGAWMRMATLRGDHLVQGDTDTLGGRNLRGLCMIDAQNGIAVGDGGLVLMTHDGGTKEWPQLDVGLSPEIRANWDLHSVHAVGSKIWIVGRPGSALLHSRNQGKSWEVLATKQPLPLHGIFFKDEQHGWAVGELGQILATGDGGKTWQIQHRASPRTPALLIHSRPESTPLDTVAVLGAVEGYMTAALRVTGPDFTSAAPARATEMMRYNAAIRQAGGVSGEMLWQFPLPSHIPAGDRQALIATWDQLHGGRATDQLLRQMVLAIRTWRPDVVITDNSDRETSEYAVETILAEAVHEAFRQAGDPKCFPEQCSTLGLDPWTAKKLYACWRGRSQANVLLDLTEVKPALVTSPQDFVREASLVLCTDAAPIPAQRGFRLLADCLENAAAHTHLMDGVNLVPGGEGRRTLSGLDRATDAEIKACRQAALLRSLAETPINGLTNSERLLGQIGPMTASLPDAQAARAIHAIANQFALQGQWSLARESYLLMVERYPAQPLTIDAFRWLLKHNSSTEARHRHELGQFLVVREETIVSKERAPLPSMNGDQKSPVPDFTTHANETKVIGEPIRMKDAQELLDLAHGKTDLTQGARATARQWYQGALELEDRLKGYGPLFAGDPAIQFPLQSARRHLGDFETPLAWYRQFAQQQPEGPWRSAALAELWLAKRSGQPPKPTAYCQAVDSRPTLDGKLDEPFWQTITPLQAKGVNGEPIKDEENKELHLLQNAAGDTNKEYPTEVKLAYDKEYLYVAVRCFHPEGMAVPPATTRKHHENLRKYDRVSLVIDLDRDYSTCFQLQIDQRGCVAEDCWGDKTWDPRWFVAVHSEARVWVAEVAIPLASLTSEPITAGNPWAFNVVRVLPGRGVQAWSLPAETPEAILRPEGMGLLMFTKDANQNAMSKK